VKPGHRAAGLVPKLKRKLSKRFIRQDGAVAVEMVLVSMLLVPLVCGLLDFGMLWQKHQTAEAAMRQSARRTAASCVVPLNDPSSQCKLGNRADDDSKALLAALSALGSAASEIEKVVVFNANGSSVSDLNGSAPAGCLEATPPIGIANECNVYGPSEFAGIATMDAATIATKFGCSSPPKPALPSSYWCPLDRGRSAATPTYVGVAVVLRHRHITGLFGSEARVKAQAIFRLEPNTLAPTAVVAGDVDSFIDETTTTTSTTIFIPILPPTSTTTTIQTSWPCPWGGGPFSSQIEYDLNCIAPPTTIAPTTTTTTTIQTSWPCVWGGTFYSQAAYDLNCIAPPTTIAPTTTTRLRVGIGNT
jgi:hypothetical protein